MKQILKNRKFEEAKNRGVVIDLMFDKINQYCH